MRRVHQYAWLPLAPLLAPALTLAAQGAKTADEKLRGLGLAPADVGAPGIGRVLMVFLLVAALAWCASWLLRRYGVKFRPGVLRGSAAIRVVARGTLPGGVVCHLVEAEGRQVLITIARSGVSSLLLGEVPPAAATPAPNPVAST